MTKVTKNQTAGAGGYGKSGCHPFFGQNLTFWRKIAFGDTWLACGKVGRKDAVAR
jgi:hypothetical protein